MAETWIEIHYCGFYDRPLMFFTRVDNQLYLFSRDFDEEADEYQDVFQIYKMPEMEIPPQSTPWAPLIENALEVLGQVSVKEITFDPTYRQLVSLESISTHLRMKP